LAQQELALALSLVQAEQQLALRQVLVLVQEQQL
jgi:hypothetical protein